MAKSNAASKAPTNTPAPEVVDNSEELEALRNSVATMQGNVDAANARADAAEAELKTLPTLAPATPEKGSSDKAAILAHFAELYPEPRKVVTTRKGYFGNKIREIGNKFTLPAGFPDAKWYVNEDSITAEEIKILVEGEAEDDE